MIGGDPLDVAPDSSAGLGLNPENISLYFDSLLAQPPREANSEKVQLYRAFYLGDVEDLERLARRLTRDGSDRESRVLALAWLCQLRFAKGDYEFIVQLFDEPGSTFDRSEYRDSWHWLALSYAALGRPDDAVSVWKKLLELNRLTPEQKGSYLYGIGEAMEALGRLREAAVSYRRVYSIEQETGYGARALLRAGMCHEKLGERELAILHYYTFLARYPRGLGSSLVRERLSELETTVIATAVETDTLKYRVVLGVFALRRDGEALLARARGAGFQEASLRREERGNKTLYLVTAGEYADPREAALRAEKIMRALPVGVTITPVQLESPVQADSTLFMPDSTLTLPIEESPDSTLEDR
jgi:tetratricopeptide (TPR) repeat protein